MKFLSYGKLITASEREKSLEGILESGSTRFCSHKIKRYFPERCQNLI